MHPAKILLLSPHVDDSQIGCGGTIANFVRRNPRCEVREAAFSFAFDPVLITEWRNAREILGISLNYSYDYPVRRLAEYRQDILEEMVNINKEYRPDMVFCPSSFDTHQDHEVIYKEAFRAFKNTTILGYELPWNNIEFRSTCFVALTQNDMDKKVEACSMFKSQSHRQFSGRLSEWATMRAMQVQIAGYAEAFEVIRWVI